MDEFEFKTTRFGCTEFYILINHLVSRRLQIINFDLLINFYLIINNNLKVLGSNKSKWSKHDSQNLLKDTYV
jgi:hypothetical protein